MMLCLGDLLNCSQHNDKQDLDLVLEIFIDIPWEALSLRWFVNGVSHHSAPAACLKLLGTSGHFVASSLLSPL